MSNTNTPVTFAIGAEEKINGTENQDPTPIIDGQIILARDTGKLFIDGKDNNGNNKRFKITSANMEEGQGTNAVQQFPQNTDGYDYESWPTETNNQSINENIISDSSVKKIYDGDKVRIKIGAFGDYSVSLNSASQATGKRAVAAGSCTVAAGKYSHSEGNDTIAAGSASHSEGITTSALGDYSHSEGSGTTAESPASHAEGLYSHAGGEASHAEGYDTTTEGMGSHAEGFNTIAKSDYQHVQGKFNEEDNNNKYAHIIGWGADDDHRKNIHTIDTEGNAWYAGNITANKIITNSISNELSTSGSITLDSNSIEIYPCIGAGQYVFGYNAFKINSSIDTSLGTSTNPWGTVYSKNITIGSTTIDETQLKALLALI